MASLVASRLAAHRHQCRAAGENDGCRRRAVVAAGMVLSAWHKSEGPAAWRNSDIYIMAWRRRRPLGVGIEW